MSPLEELRQLGARVDAAVDLEELRPIFERMTAISHEHPDNFEVMLSADHRRRCIVDKGKVLREQQEALEAEYAEQGEYVEEPPAAEPEPDGFAGFGPAVAPPVGSMGATESFNAPPPAAAPKPLKATGGFDAPPPIAPPPIAPPPPAPAAGGAGKKIAIIGGLAGLLALLAGGAYWFLSGHKVGPGSKPPARSVVAIDVATNPPGAAIQVNGEAKCKSNCRVELAPGSYQLTAVLEGFEPGAAALNVVAGNPMTVSLSMAPQPASLRIMADMEGASVMLDGKPAGNVQDGQFALDRIAAGAHAVKIVGKGATVEFPFETVSGKPPVVTGPVKAGKMLAVLVTSMGPVAKVFSNVASKVAVNGQAQGQSSAGGLDLKDVPVGEQTLSLGEGQAEKRLVVSFGPAPAIAAFIKQPEVTTGTLVISTGEDDVTVSLNGKEWRRRTARGTLRVPVVGTVVVHVAKAGFQPEPAQKVEVKKGEEKKVSFVLKPLPRVAAMQIRGGVPGTQMFLDDQPIGRVGPDGTFSAANIPPGEHTLEARRDGFLPKRVQRSFRAGETMGIAASDIALAPAGATVHVAVTPGDATVLYRRADETQWKPASGSTLKLDPGAYVFVARSPGYSERTVSATVGAGETRSVEISLNKVEAPKPRPTLTWAGWSKEGVEFVRKGGNRVVVASGPMVGTLSFTAHLVKGGGVFRGARLRWFIDDGSGSTQYELDKRKFQAKGPAGGRSKELPKEGGDEDPKTYAIEIDLTPDRIVHKVRSGGGFVTVDSQLAKVGADNKFGFTIPGNDEISVSDLRFVPK